jgi:hypothetical protein
MASKMLVVHIMRKNSSKCFLMMGFWGETGACGIGQLGVNLTAGKIWHAHNLETGAQADPLLFLQSQSICTESECIMLVGPSKICLAGPGMFLS